MAESGTGGIAASGTGGIADSARGGIAASGTGGMADSACIESVTRRDRVSGTPVGLAEWSLQEAVCV